MVIVWTSGICAGNTCLVELKTQQEQSERSCCSPPWCLKVRSERRHLRVFVETALCSTYILLMGGDAYSAFFSIQSMSQSTIVIVSERIVHKCVSTVWLPPGSSLYKNTVASSSRDRLIYHSPSRKVTQIHTFTQPDISPRGWILLYSKTARNWTLLNESNNEMTIIKLQ